MKLIVECSPLRVPTIESHFCVPLAVPPRGDSGSFSPKLGENPLGNIEISFVVGALIITTGAKYHDGVNFQHFCERREDSLQRESTFRGFNHATIRKTLSKSWRNTVYNFNLLPLGAVHVFLLAWLFSESLVFLFKMPPLFRDCNKQGGHFE